MAGHRRSDIVRMDTKWHGTCQYYQKLRQAVQIT